MTGRVRGEVVIGDRYYILASSVAGDLPKLVLKHDETFLVADSRGDFPELGESEFGLYVAGTRALSHLELRIHGVRPLLLNASEADEGVQLTVDLANPDLKLDSGVIVLGRTLRLSRRILLDGQRMCQTVRIESFALETYEIELTWEFANDFVDVFEVRGFTRPRRGALLSPRIDAGRVQLAYEGLDGIVRRSAIRFDPVPQDTGAGSARYRLAIAPGERTEIAFEVSAVEDGRSAGPPVRYGEALARRRKQSDDRSRRTARIRSSDELFNRWVSRSWRDLRMLITDTQDGAMPYAGIPWYVAPFGRDSVLTALQLLPFDPSVARGTLRFLARMQGREDDPVTDQEPGKILHEYRQGELANCGEIVFTPYYGSVDATPLFVILLGEYWRWTGDEALLHELWPPLVAALGWMTASRAVDGSGFLTYARRSEHGLLQQGWKDSHDSVMHASGGPAPAPIALIEAQGYKFRALHGAALVAEIVGHPEMARTLARTAAELEQRVNEEFWLEDEMFYALALDGNMAPCRVISSNPGHCLWAGLPGTDRAALVARRLMRDDVFSGWGIRTLAAGERRYNPMSYHNGSVWPHDTALIAAGFKQYLLTDEFLALSTGLFDAVSHYDARMPELFCGFERLAGQAPIRYPAACSPQAWSAGAVFQLLGAMLGLEADAAHNRLTSRNPVLPDWLDWLEVRGLRIRNSIVDLLLSRGRQGAALEVLDRQGDAEIVVRR